MYTLHKRRCIHKGGQISPKESNLQILKDLFHKIEIIKPTEDMKPKTFKL